MSAAESMHQSYIQRGVEKHCLEPLLQYSGESILDVGCGSGAYVKELSGHRDIRGVDGVRFENWSGWEGLFEVADAARLPYRDNSVDTISSFEVLEHLSDPHAALEEFHRVCRKNIILTVPNCEITPGMTASSLLYSHWSDPTHRNFFDLESIQEEVRRAGFEVAKAELTNRINIAPFIMEAFGVSGLLPRFAYRLLKKAIRRKHYISILVVAQKHVEV